MKIKTYFKQAQQIELENGTIVDVKAPDDLANVEKPLHYWEYDNGTFTFNQVQQDAEKQAEVNRQRMSEIQVRLRELDVKTFKFIDGDYTAEEYEPYRQEKLALRNEYKSLEQASL